MLSPKVTNSTTASFNITCILHGAAVSLDRTANTTAQVRVDGTATWTSLLSLVSPTQFLSFNASTGVLIITGLITGEHTLEVRAVDAVVGVDPTPWTVRWRVDQALPTISFTLTPPHYSAVPTDTATFAVACSNKPLPLQYRYTLLQQSPAVGQSESSASWVVSVDNPGITADGTCLN